MIDSVYQAYGNKLRVRVCGLCLEKDYLLMVNHHGIVDGDFWAPPGGGLQFGETAEICLKREFFEETGLEIQIQSFLFNSEFIHLPLHALELFFLVSRKSGDLQRGFDPEMIDDQIIKDVKYMSWAEIDRLSPVRKHGIFRTSPFVPLCFRQCN